MIQEGDIKRLKRTLAQSTGLHEGYDTYFFLSRMGDNYQEYGFNWEPFRDLAGPLLGGNESIPIIVMSDDKSRNAPEVEKVNSPISHYQFRVSPNLGAEVIANHWLELIVDNGAKHGQYKGPFDWFVNLLGIKVETLSLKSRNFLML